ncbi:F-box domain-containing protein [Favolaschia claudopus]|uniref:F-box domain-containing protein n=1 Tax=Favolaschia claudopus TaxID=2862362 RepID=A0AAW0CBG8_9AGAR
MLEALAADRARLTELECQISDLERSLAALKSDKSAVQKRLTSYTYPVLTLPNEIVSEIFVRFLPRLSGDSPPYSDCPPLVGRFSPIILTRICRQWRETALAIPELWRAVSLCAKDIPPSVTDIRKIWLRRAGVCPLHIQVDDFFVSSRAQKVGFRGEELLAVILPYRERWEHIQLSLERCDPQAAVDGPMPLLRKLVLSVQDLSPRLDFSDAPLLRSVDLDKGAARNIKLSWDRLTSLRLINIWPHNCIPYLRMATNLVQCELDMYALNRDTSFHTTPYHVTLPSLRSLTIKASRDITRIDVLGCFTLPAISRLDICELLLQSDPIDSLKSFITRSGCELHHVRITGRRIRASEYHDAFPSIQELVLSDRF